MPSTLIKRLVFSGDRNTQKKAGRRSIQRNHKISFLDFLCDKYSQLNALELDAGRCRFRDSVMCVSDR